MKKEDLVKAIREIGITESDTILVQSSFIPFRRIVGGPTTIIEALLEVLQPNGTLIMPAFNWDDFGKKGIYSKISTKPQTGTISEIFSKWKGVHRVYHPIHGFTLLGARARELSKNLTNKSSFEKSSLFGRLHEINAKLMLMGINYRDGLTFFHYVEEMVGVPYRKFLPLRGKIEELDGSIHDLEFPYYGRLTMDIHYDINKIESHFNSESIPSLNSKKLGMATLRVLQAKEAFECIKSALQKDPNLVLIK